QPSARIGASNNTVELTLKNGQLEISNLSPQDRVQLIGDQQISETLTDDRAGATSDFGNISVVTPTETEPTADAVVLPVSSQQVRHRRMAGLIGVEYLYSLRRLQLHAQALSDFTGVHDGYELRLAAIFPWQIRENRYA